MGDIFIFSPIPGLPNKKPVLTPPLSPYPSPSSPIILFYTLPIPITFSPPIIPHLHKYTKSRGTYVIHISRFKYQRKPVKNKFIIFKFLFSFFLPMLPKLQYYLWFFDEFLYQPKDMKKIRLSTNSDLKDRSYQFDFNAVLPLSLAYFYNLVF